MEPTRVDETTVAELIQLLQNESASIDTQFQLWTTITSAVLIASFAARLHLSFSLKIVIAVMYLLASATIGLRYANDASQFEFLMGELRKHSRRERWRAERKRRRANGASAGRGTEKANARQ